MQLYLNENRSEKILFRKVQISYKLDERQIGKNV